MKTLSLLTTVLIILSAFLTCDAFSIKNVKNFVSDKVNKITNPVKNIINNKHNEEEDDRRDERNYYNEINIEYVFIFYIIKITIK